MGPLSRLLDKLPRFACVGVAFGRRRLEGKGSALAGLVVERALVGVDGVGAEGVRRNAGGCSGAVDTVEA